MNTARKLNETPKERLERVARSSRPFRRELRGPNYLIAAALLLLFLSMVVVGIVGGTLGSNVVAEYARRIMEWVGSPGR
jgi:ABC-type Na+ efflux pump permease subunit